MMRTGDANYIKQLNRKILIEGIIKGRSISRSDLARATGLNKATVSTQVSDFLDEQIVIEKYEHESTNRGRRPILLEINDQAGYSIGIDIDATHLSLLFMNLKGKKLHTAKVIVEFNDLSKITGQLISLLTPFIEEYNKKYQPLGLVGIGIGIHGIVNNKQEITFTPKHEWSNIIMKEQLEEAFNTQVYIDNNANLSVFAEQTFDEHISNLFSITLHSGIGLGIINENKIYRGYQGFAGEIGHMIVETDGKPCTCGNKGCWELYASEQALTTALKETKPVLTPAQAFERHSKQQLDIVEEYLDYLAIGLNNIINIFNPDILILNGSFINRNFLYITDITERLKSKMNNYREIRASALGEHACVLGGAAIAIKNFFEIDTIDFTNSDR